MFAVLAVGEVSPEQEECPIVGWRYGLGMMLALFTTSVKTYLRSDKALDCDIF